MTSIHDLARETGVSTATVSRALRGLPRVSDETRAKVMDAALRLGYVPSPHAVGLASGGQTRTVAIVVLFVTRWFFATVVHGAEQVLRERGYDVLLYNIGGDPDARRRVLLTQLVTKRADALIVVGEGDGADPMIRLAARAAKPIHLAQVRPLNGAKFRDRNCLAFAAIGDPEKFFKTLEDAHVRLAQRKSFPDHHPFTEDEIRELLAEAELYGLDLITTAKDYVRLQAGHGKAVELVEKTSVLEIDLAFDSPDVPNVIIENALTAFKRRRA